ncbi:hypothetical protein AAG895_17860 [Thauera sp. JM12B12]|uniref:hypothetical protein n=1 Tax=Thauera sp. JM12B12 TaxID=3142262 RepID=UPI0031F3EB11
MFDPKDVLHHAFLYSAFEASPEHEGMLQDLRRAVEENLGQHPGLLRAFDEACIRGARARALAAKLTSVLNKNGDTDAIDAWLTEHGGRDGQILRHLGITRAKWNNRRQHHATANPNNHTSTINQVHIPAGAHHPNSLRHLAPSAHWRVLIDETGRHFDEQADGLNIGDWSLGRLVALAIPDRADLPELGPCHSADESVEAVDAVVQNLLAHRVGIFGFTVKDPAILANRWISHVALLVRWVLAQLPLEAGKAPEVEILIEQNRGYTPDVDLRVLREILESDFLRLAAERYKGLRLSIGFMDKDFPQNCYVDAIAFTWGSQAAASRDRLKKTAWLGSCLLRPADQALERLYLALHAGRELPAAQWYELCAAAASEPPGGLLKYALDKLGRHRSDQKHLTNYWNACLGEVRQRMQAKTFKLHELGEALAWLQTWAPTGSGLPPAEALALETSRLALDNHRGDLDQARLLRCIELCKTLHDEAPAEACEAILRIAVSTSNVFEFDVMRETIEQWLAEPIAVPGLLNHAKLHSTLGQIEAFAGNSSAAKQHFERAIAAFNRLSNSDQAEREIAQTRNYRLIAALDDPGQPMDQLEKDLTEHFRKLIHKGAPDAISRSLAQSGQEKRYAHHLWLRALVAHPETFKVARDAYLGAQPQWKSEQDHPWPLINAYRGWLLLDAGQHTPAKRQFSIAVQQCRNEDNGPTLQWMGKVLHVVAQALGVPTGITLPRNMTADLQQRLPNAPHQALTAFEAQASTGNCSIDDIHVALRQCLPFNFH